MIENPNNSMPPQQPGTQGPAGPQEAGNPQFYSGGYQDRYQGGYGYPPTPGNHPHWAHQDYHRGGYQDQYQSGYGHSPAPGNHPFWAHHDHYRGGHSAYYGAPPAPAYSPFYGGHPGYHVQPPYWPAPAAYAPNPHDGGLSSFFNFRDERFVKGAITGATLTFLLTNDSVQKNAIKSLVKLWCLFQGGVEEIKERFKDAEAEIKTETPPPN